MTNRETITITASIQPVDPSRTGASVEVLTADLDAAGARDRLGAARPHRAQAFVTEPQSDCHLVVTRSADCPATQFDRVIP